MHRNDVRPDVKILILKSRAKMVLEDRNWLKARKKHFKEATAHHYSKMTQTKGGSVFLRLTNLVEQLRACTP